MHINEQNLQAARSAEAWWTPVPEFARQVQVAARFLDVK
jgi:hypothetical protein